MIKIHSTFHKPAGLMLTTLLAAGTFAACSGGGGGGTAAEPGGNQAQAPSASAAKEPLKVSLMIPYWNPEPPKMDSEPAQKIMSHTNTRLEISWVPAVAYRDKLNAGIASQELPQIIYVLANWNKESGLVNAVRSGMFWEIGPYLKEFPNLSRIDPKLFAEATVDGKIYGIFKEFPQARDGIIIRKDWLDALGLQEPQTLDELIQVMKAFTTQDPDKNGKDDTFGFGVNNNVSGFGLLNIYRGGPNGWEAKDGKFTPDFMTPEYMETLKLYKSFYDENIINRDFAVLKNSYEMLNKGKAGMFLGPLDDVESRFADLFKGFPQAKLDVIGSVAGPKGSRVPTRGIFPPQFLFPKTSIKTEADLKQILGYMDRMADPDMQNLFTWGIEGVHYKMENGKPVRTDAQKFTTEIAALDFLRYDYGAQAMQGQLPEVVEKYRRLQAENMKIAVSNPVQALISPTFTDKGSELDKVILDARTKFIMGEIAEDGFNKAVETWRKNGGDQVIQEYAGEYAKINNK